ncbi:hypothetical protein BGZ76_005408 [Entomortierella beljakovae]|nr:hypothetical protein BGZ76_005408 [Entomortierella beljakovae]
MGFFKDLKKKAEVLAKEVTNEIEAAQSQANSRARRDSSPEYNPRNNAGNGYGSSAGNGYGNSAGNGYGNSAGDGYGNSAGNGYGNSTGNGYGDSTGNGTGNSAGNAPEIRDEYGPNGLYGTLGNVSVNKFNDTLTFTVTSYSTLEQRTIIKYYKKGHGFEEDETTTLPPRNSWNCSVMNADFARPITVVMGTASVNITVSSNMSSSFQIRA